jgi:hypothetical protein
VLRLYTEITGKALDLENLPEDVDEWLIKGSAILNISEFIDWMLIVG